MSRFAGAPKPVGGIPESVSIHESWDELKRDRTEWQRRVALLKSESIDPDTLDERARAMLNYLGPRELTLILKKP